MKTRVTRITQNRWWKVFPLIVAAAVVVSAQASQAYEVDAEVSGVTVSGQVVFKGTVPKTQLLPVHRDSAVCGATMPDEALLVDPGSRGVVGVVISVEGVKKGKPLPEDSSVTIENRTCRFIKRANATGVGSMVRIKNDDPVMHNTHIRRGTKFGGTVINVAQPAGVPTIEKALRKAGLLDVRCDAHTFMYASIHVFDHPYFAVTDQTGRFELRDVPPGTYTLRYWHESFGAQQQELRVPDSGHLSLDLALGR